MKQVLHKITSLMMAFVVLLSTMSFTLDMHFCGDTLVETAVFNKAKGCGMEIEKPTTETCSFSKKSCCSDTQLLIDGQNEMQQKADNISFEQEFFITTFIYTYSNLFNGLETTISTYQEYKPPVVTKQIFKLDETFLI